MQKRRIYIAIEKLMRSPADEQSPLFVIFATPLEFFYQKTLMLRRLLSKLGINKPSRLVGEQTISIGNLVVGGVGKTPLVVSLCTYLISKGKHPAVLTRGYKSGLKDGQFAFFIDGKCVETNGTDELFADEARMISFHCDSTPVIVGSDRLAAARAFLNSKQHASSVTHWILDDGFQHFRIARDLDIVLLSGNRPFGNYHLLPRGILREPLTNLDRADHLFIINANSREVDEIKEILIDNEVDKAPISLVTAKGYRLKQLTKTPVDRYHTTMSFAALAGIANPERFLNDLDALGIRIDSPLIIPDHSRVEFETLRRLTENKDAIATTSKDFWREPELFEKLSVPTFVLEMAIEGCKWQELVKLESTD